jgi:predicted nucleic acid-binding protein
VEPVDTAQVAEGSLLLVDSGPLIHVLEGHPVQASRLRPLFERHARGELQFAVTTISIAEVMAGPLGGDDEALARRYRAVLESWQVVDLTADIAEGAARLRASLRLKLPDAIQAASAIAINADALVTSDRALSRLKVPRVLA